MKAYTFTLITVSGRFEQAVIGLNPIHALLVGLRGLPKGIENILAVTCKPVKKHTHSHHTNP